MLAVALAAVAADQASKALVVAELNRGEQATVIPGLLDVVHVHNPGIAFGLFDQGPNLILPITLAALAGIIGWFAVEGRRRSSMWLPVGLLVGGAVGNLIDRIRLGHVTDFIDLSYWPSFNAADAAITVGVVALLAMALFGPGGRPSADPAGHGERTPSTGGPARSGGPEASA